MNLNVENTIYTKDAKMLRQIRDWIDTFETELQCMMAQHGHSKVGSLALVVCYQKLNDMEKQVDSCIDKLPEEVKENLDILWSGILNEES